MAEFLKLYADACEARPMGLHELYVATAWPLDNPELPRLLQQLLLVSWGSAAAGQRAEALEVEGMQGLSRAAAGLWTRGSPG